QQLSTYLKAGIPLTDAMRILSKQMGRNDNIKRTFDSVVYNLTLGENFSNCLDKQGDAFPSLLINMVKSAEATGDLEGTLDEMADYYQATESTRKEMISALTYPSMVFLFSIAVVIFILVYLIPQFVTIYQTANVTLNPITQFIIAASDFLQANLVYIIVVLITTIVVLVVLYKNLKAFKYYAQTMMMKLPLFGNLIIYKEMMIFTKTFASLLRNNVFITESMDILGKVTSNEIYREIMINTINYIGRGEKISSAFKDHWAIPEVAYYMMVTGESTGELAEMMGKVSDYYAEQHKMIIDSMKSLIEPVLIIFLAVVVGGIMIAVIVPMFGLYSEIM
ncbi:MAG: type II secretion system F family protein, partial [Bacilli bacterium]|nr:type II secretion system F family protein [Bacilli bacterium]